MARVLLLSLVFAPDGVSTAQLMSEVAVDLHRAGHRVSVVTTQPHYNRDAVAEAAQPLTRMWGGLLFRSDFQGIPVIHTAMPRKRGSFLGRVPGWIVFHILAFAASVLLVERPDVVMVPSPLLTAGVLGWLVARLRGGAFVYSVLELYPDLAIKVGQLRNPVVIALLRRLERFVYRRAAAVTVIAEGMKRAVEAKGVRPERVEFIPNFVDVDLLRPGPKENEFAREHGLPGRFVVSYAGNMGFAQGLEVLLDAAALLVDDPGIVVLFVGDGVLRGRLISEAGMRSVASARFVEHQPYARVPEIYAASDLCVVPMVGAVDAEAVPSKFLRIMACGRPVLAMADADSELAREVGASGGGIVVSPVSADAVADAVRTLRAEPERVAVMGAAGRAYAATRYSRTVVTARYARLLADLAAGGAV